MAWEKFEYARIDTVLPARILVVDELAEFVEVTDRKLMRLVDVFQGNLQSIARLGRSAHIHEVLATQSASGNLFPPSLKNNITARNICGRVEATISRTAIDSEEGESLPTTPGHYLGYIKGDTQNYQGYFTPTNVVLGFGSVKEGFDPETGLSLEGDGGADFSNLGSYADSAEFQAEENNMGVSLDGGAGAMGDGFGSLPGTGVPGEIPAGAMSVPDAGGVPGEIPGAAMDVPDAGGVPGEIPGAAMDVPDAGSVPAGDMGGVSSDRVGVGSVVGDNVVSPDFGANGGGSGSLDSGGFEEFEITSETPLDSSGFVGGSDSGGNSLFGQSLSDLAASGSNSGGSDNVDSSSGGHGLISFGGGGSNSGGGDVSVVDDDNVGNVDSKSNSGNVFDLPVIS